MTSRGFTVTMKRSDALDWVLLTCFAWTVAATASGIARAEPVLAAAISAASLGMSARFLLLIHQARRSLQLVLVLLGVDPKSVTSLQATVSPGRRQPTGSTSLSADGESPRSSK